MMMANTTFFDALPEQAPDRLLDLSRQVEGDPRINKIDLGVGIYRDETGRTPIMAAVKAAEQRLVEAQITKSYIRPEGDAGFLDLLASIVFGGAKTRWAIDGLQTPGGTGALRLAADLLAQGKPRTIWIGTPTWSNHAPIFSAAGLAIKTYQFFDVKTQTVDVDALLSTLANADQGDVVLLHACCHNPTGALIDHETWKSIATVMSERELIPLFDNAYQGFGAGLVEDAAGMTTVLEDVEEGLVAVSCSKNFSLYRERTGALYFKGTSPLTVVKAVANAAAFARINYSMPPAHGAAIVSSVLSDEVLKLQWMAELDATRERVKTIRHALAESLVSAGVGLSEIAKQRGMFSLLPIEVDEVLKLRVEHGIYMAESGRINIAGLQSTQTERFAKMIAPHLHTF